MMPGQWALVVVLLLWGATGIASAGDFRRGVNINQWLDTYATGPVPAEELKALRAAGFDHVRLPVDPMKLGWQPAVGPRLSGIDRLMVAVEAIQASGLDVIIDMHPDHATQRVIEDDTQGAEAFVSLWSWLARQLRMTSPQRVAIELLNEPQYVGVGGDLRWSRYQARLLKTVRASLPTHPVVVTGRHTGTLDGLIELTPLEDPNLIYSFHFYAPSIFTHQGASWMRNVPWSTAGHWHDLLYPAAMAEQASAWMDTAGDPIAGPAEMDRYLADDWSRAEVVQVWSPLVTWARRYPNARIRLGEFGVIRANVDPASRYRWVRDVRAEAEAQGWSWTLWNYGSDFGITTSSNIRGEPRGTLEPAARTALGLAEVTP